MACPTNIKDSLLYKTFESHYEDSLQKITTSVNANVSIDNKTVGLSQQFISCVLNAYYIIAKRKEPGLPIYNTTDLKVADSYITKIINETGLNKTDALNIKSVLDSLYKVTSNGSIDYRYLDPAGYVVTETPWALIGVGSIVGLALLYYIFK